MSELSDVIEKVAEIIQQGCTRHRAWTRYQMFNPSRNQRCAVGFLLLSLGHTQSDMTLQDAYEALDSEDVGMWRYGEYYSSHPERILEALNNALRENEVGRTFENEDRSESLLDVIVLLNDWYCDSISQLICVLYSWSNELYTL